MEYAAAPVDRVATACDAPVTWRWRAGFGTDLWSRSTVLRRTLKGQKDVRVEIQRLRHEQRKRTAPVTAPSASDAC